MPARFTTDRSLFETFPTALRHIRVEPRDRDPVALGRELAALGRLDEAVSLAAYLLPRRDAVVWGCRSLRALHGDPRGLDTPCLQAAENWVRQSDNAHRAAARAAALTADDAEPSTWLARAAAWAGGNLLDTVPSPTPQHMTAVAVRIALLLALRRVDAMTRPGRGRACLEDGLRLAEIGEGR